MSYCFNAAFVAAIQNKLYGFGFGAALSTLQVLQLESRRPCAVGLCWLLDEDPAIIGYGLLLALVYLAQHLLEVAERT